MLAETPLCEHTDIGLVRQSAKNLEYVTRVCLCLCAHVCVCVLVARLPGKRANYNIKASLPVTFLRLLCMLLHPIRKGRRQTWSSC